MHCSIHVYLWVNLTRKTKLGTKDAIPWQWQGGRFYGSARKAFRVSWSNLKAKPSTVSESAGAISKSIALPQKYFLHQLVTDPHIPSSSPLAFPSPPVYNTNFKLRPQEFRLVNLLELFSSQPCCFSSSLKLVMGSQTGANGRNVKWQPMAKQHKWKCFWSSAFSFRGDLWFDQHRTGP